MENENIIQYALQKHFALIVVCYCEIHFRLHHPALVEKHSVFLSLPVPVGDKQSVLVLL